MAKPRGKRAIARGISRTLPLDACKVDLSKIRRLPEDALSSVWGRINRRARRFKRDQPLHDLASYAINLAAAKSSARMYTGQQRKHAVAIYMHAVKLAKERLQSHCAARGLGRR